MATKFTRLKHIDIHNIEFYEKRIIFGHFSFVTKSHYIAYGML